MVTSVSQQNGATVNVSNPCLPDGVTKTHTQLEIYTSCVNETDGVEVFGFALNPPSHLASNSNVSFLGHFDIDKCVGTVEKVFNFRSCNSSGVCNSSHVYEVPQVSGKFVVSGVEGERVCVCVVFRGREGVCL